MMKKSILFLSILSLIIFSSCGGKSHEERQEELAMEKQNYESGLNSIHKRIIQDIFEKDIELNKTEIPPKNSILVVQKRKNEIIPYISINNKLRNKGYDISYNSNSLNYIVIVKTKGIKSGTYTDGSYAWDSQTKIFAIDTKTGKVNLIEEEYIQAPKRVQTNRNSDPSDSMARGIEGSELVQLIINKVLEK